MEATAKKVEELNELTVKQLKRLAADEGVDLGKARVKAEIIAALTENFEPPPEADSGNEPPTSGTPPADSTGDEPNGDGADEPPAVEISRVLKVTKPLIKGDDVRAVQRALTAQRLNCGTDSANGVYNAATAAAVRYFQAGRGLIVSGKVDKFTAAALGLAWVDT